MNLTQREHPDQLEPQRARALLRLSWLLALLLLAMLWLGVSEGLHQRMTLLDEQQQVRQAEWLRLATRASDDRLRNLHKELRLFADDAPSLSRDASELAPLHLGRLWRVGPDGVVQLHGPKQKLAPGNEENVREWLNSMPGSTHLSLLPAPTLSPPAAHQDDWLQVMLPLCDDTGCHRALTGFLPIRSLLDPEQGQSEQPYALLDEQGNIIASSGSNGSAPSNKTKFSRAGLVEVPLQLGVQYHSSDIVRSFSLFALGLLSLALVISALILLLMFRISQLLRHVEHHNSQLSQSRQLLALTNNSLREKMRRLIDEQRDQQTLIETVQVGVLIADAADLSILTSNDAVTRMTGMSRQMLQRQKLPELFSQPQRWCELLTVLQEQQAVTDREAQLQHHHEQTCWSMTSMRYLIYRERQAIAVSLIDITERIIHAQNLQDEKLATERALAQLQATQHELYQRATLDDLTGLANRRHFLSFAGKALERARLANEAIAVVLIDLDHFKCINDVHGHAAGDTALRHFASGLRAALPESAMAGRMGGEEFALLLPGITLADARQMIDRLRADMAAQFFYAEGKLLQLTFSAGIAAPKPAQQQDLSVLLRMADKALYQAKDLGRNRVECATS